MCDRLIDGGRERWTMLSGEADEERRARRAGTHPRVTVRERVAATLIALARRIGPTVPVGLAPSCRRIGTP